MSLRIVDLPWLPPAPADFKDRCSQFAQKKAGNGAEIRGLGLHALSVNQLNRLHKAAKATTDSAPLTPVRLAVLSNSNTEFLPPVLSASALRHGVSLEVMILPYGQVAQEVFDPNSELYRLQADLVFLLLDHRGLPLKEGAGNALAYLEEMHSAIISNCGATVIFQTVAPLPKPLFGNFDVLYEPGETAKIAAFNQGLVELARRGPCILLDTSGLASTVGLDQWHDPAQWHLAKLPFAQNCLPLFGDYFGRLLAAVKGKSRRCLVLDLDNTLWGGVLGDEGMDGIVLGQGNALGEAFLAVQKMALALRDRGVMLAVCSKNDDALARKAFREHPEMLLKEEHITIFQANWEDKPSNIEAIAKAMNLGLESLVFLDDNPAERAQVRAALPEVAVPELPMDPAFYPRVLLSAGYFDAVSFSDEDRSRVAQYQANAKRVEVQSKARNLGDYLDSLDMVLTVRPFDQASRARVTQLINKSNQFNLTTKRYTENQVAEIELDEKVYTSHARLHDAFGDNGIISVVICREEDEVWDIDTWLMSCRVLGRRVEEALLNTVAAAAKRAGARYLRGRYIPSPRNELVANHFQKLDFELLDRQADGSSLWQLALASRELTVVPIRVDEG